ncbi:MAG: hypothetical protein Q9171_003532 [Xanthocarpia ochracea]
MHKETASIHTIPDEILSKILGHVMHSSTPVNLTTYLEHPNQSYPYESNLRFPHISCHKKLCHWLSAVQGHSLCTCDSPKPQSQQMRPLPTLFPPSQAPHLKDWVLANSISHRFRIYAKEKFFSEKEFSIPPALFKRLYEKQIKCFSPENTNLLLNHTRHIIIPLPACSAASAFLALPRYWKHFEHLRVLDLWPGRRGETCPNFTAGLIKREAASEELTDLLRQVGLGGDHVVRVNMIRPVHEAEWRQEVRHMEVDVFPYLRWAGKHKAST